MYYITTKSNTSFEVLGQSANRADARQMAKELGGTVRNEAEYEKLSVARAAGAADAAIEVIVDTPIAVDHSASNKIIATMMATEAPAESNDDHSSVYGFAVHGQTHCKHCGIHLSNGVGEHDQEVNGKKVKHDQFEFECLACGNEFGPAIAKKSAPTAKGTRAPVVNTSTAVRPCKLVWQIADDVFLANPDAKRAEVLAECVNHGIAFYTARTQYQQWLGVRKEMAAREAQQAAKKGA